MRVCTFQASGPVGRKVLQFVGPGEVFEGPSGGRREGYVGHVLHLKTRPLHEVSGFDT